MDLSRLPVGEAIIGFLAAAVVITFAVAFAVVDTSESSTEEPGDDDVPATPVAGGAEIAMGDNFFEPTDITVASGETVTFNIENQGAVVHNMHISVDGEYADSVCEPGGAAPCSDPGTVPPGDTAVLEWDVSADLAGSQIPFRCDFHPVEMTGTITVQ